MRKRVMLFAAPLCAVAIAASVAVASPSSAEHSSGPKLDKLHAERPIAATTRTARPSAPGEFEAQVKAVQDYVTFVDVSNLIRSMMLEDYLAYQRAVDSAPVATARTPQRSASSSVSSNSNPGLTVHPSNAHRPPLTSRDPCHTPRSSAFSAPLRFSGPLLLHWSGLASW